MLYKIVKEKHHLIGCLVRCKHCGILFLTCPQNAGRSDLGCPFGCRDYHRKADERRRCNEYYRSDEGKLKKRILNSRRNKKNIPNPPLEEPGSSEKTISPDSSREIHSQETDRDTRFCDSSGKSIALDPSEEIHSQESTTETSFFNSSGESSAHKLSENIHSQESTVETNIFNLSGEPGAHKLSEKSLSLDSSKETGLQESKTATQSYDSSVVPPAQHFPDEPRVQNTSAEVEKLPISFAIISYIRAVLSLVESRYVPFDEVLEMVKRLLRQRSIGSCRKTCYTDISSRSNPP